MTELVQGMDDQGEDVHVYLNEWIPDSSLWKEVEKYIPKNFNAVNGIFSGLYVSCYFQGGVFLVTDIKRNITCARISNEYENQLKTLFLVSIFRTHMNRHWIAHGYHVYHASGIYDMVKEEAFLVVGPSGTGKTTFALEAVKRGPYRIISEDKVILNPKTNQIFGCAIVHVKENDMDQYKVFTNHYSLINGGYNKKYSFILPEKYYKRYGNFNHTVFLNQSYEDERPVFCEIKKEEKCMKLFNQSQDGIYLPNEQKERDQAYQYIKSKPVFELYRGNERYNFKVYVDYWKGNI